MLNITKDHKSFITFEFGSQSPRVRPYIVKESQAPYTA